MALVWHRICCRAHGMAFFLTGFTGLTALWLTSSSLAFCFSERLRPYSPFAEIGWIGLLVLFMAWEPSILDQYNLPVFTLSGWHDRQ